MRQFLGYTEQRYDSEIGLYNYKNRYYAPAIGRFLQPDPIGYDGGDLNLYSYVGNDGLNQTDSLGLAAFCPGSIPVTLLPDYLDDPDYLYQAQKLQAQINLLQFLAQTYPDRFPCLSAFFSSINPNSFNVQLNPYTGNTFNDFGSVLGTSSANPLSYSTFYGDNADNNKFTTPLDQLAHEIGHQATFMGFSYQDANDYSNLPSREVNSYIFQNEVRDFLGLPQRVEDYTSGSRPFLFPGYSR